MLKTNASIDETISYYKNFLSDRQYLLYFGLVGVSFIVVGFILMFVTGCKKNTKTDFALRKLFSILCFVTMILIAAISTLGIIYAFKFNQNIVEFSNDSRKIEEALDLLKDFEDPAQKLQFSVNSMLRISNELFEKKKNFEMKWKSENKHCNEQFNMEEFKTAKFETLKNDLFPSGELEMTLKNDDIYTNFELFEKILNSVKKITLITIIVIVITITTCYLMSLFSLYFTFYKKKYFKSFWILMIVSTLVISFYISVSLPSSLLLKDIKKEFKNDPIKNIDECQKLKKEMGNDIPSKIDSFLKLTEYESISIPIFPTKSDFDVNCQQLWDEHIPGINLLLKDLNDKLSLFWPHYDLLAAMITNDYEKLEGFIVDQSPCDIVNDMVKKLINNASKSLEIIVISMIALVILSYLFVFFIQLSIKPTVNDD